MRIFKQQTTAQLDDVTRLADETLAVYDDLVGEIEDASLRRRIAAEIQEQHDLIRALFRARQEGDALPQAGEPERGHVLALIASIKTFLASDDSPLIQKFLQLNSELRDAANSAETCPLPDHEYDLIAKLIVSCNSLERLLRTVPTQANL